MIESNADAFEKFRKNNLDIVFNFSENANGISREAQIPAMLDMLNIPYTGSDPLTLTSCLDKARTKEILTYHKIPTPNFIIIEGHNLDSDVSLNYPLILKPIGEGSSKGIFNSSLINNFEELKKQTELMLKKYNQAFILEEYLPGREFTVALIGNKDETEVLPIIELNFNSLPKEVNPIYSFEAKWIFDTKENQLDLYTCPSNIDSELENKIKNTSLAAYKALRCKDWSRIDIRLDINGIPNIIEINPLPGVLPDPKDNSCFPKAARVAGMNYDELINSVLYHASKRYNLI
ncbi:MAG: ATP-grasp domain-containing protein [Ignavibacteria bacterium]|jgi:D-alanine-D-alanine ligase